MNRNVAVIIPTYNRPDMLRKCVDNIQRHIVLDREDRLSIFIGDDGDRAASGLINFRLDHLVYRMSGPKKGLGANLNSLLRHVFSLDYKIVIQMDDDHILNHDYDIRKHVDELLKPDTDIGWIRIMQIAAHNYVADLDESYWKVRWSSPELYIPSNRPHIKHKRFHDMFGYYREGLTLGQTEEQFGHQCKDYARENGEENTLKVAVPLEGPSEWAWSHEGKSWQLEGH